jgi:hypothetical protein
MTKLTATLLALCATLSVACAGSEPAPSGAESNVSAGSANAGGEDASADAALVAELKTVLAGQEFISESEFPWTIVQGDGRGVEAIDAAAIDARLGAVIEPIDGSGRDLAKLRSEEESFDELFDGLEDGGEGPDEAYSRARKLLTTHLTDLRVIKFDVRPSGDQDTGPIIYVVAGKSAAGNLIALVTYAVAT